jgi:hypothetical protein
VKTAPRQSVALLAFAAIAVAPGAFATTITFERSATLGGWHERNFIASSWIDATPDSMTWSFADSNGDLRGFNGGGSTKWLASPTFILDVGDLVISQVYGMTGGVAPTSDADVNENQTGSGWSGIALRDNAGNFVYTYSIPAVWNEVVISSDDLAPFVGQELSLNLINSNSNNDMLYVNRPITISGSLVPEPATVTLSVVGFLALLRRRRASYGGTVRKIEDPWAI